LDDDRLRKRVFWVVLIGSIVFVAANHGLERLMRYDIDAAQPNVKWGSYGLALARYDRAEDPRPVVLMVGNSVYQNHAIPAEIQAIADAEGLDARFVNYAVVGSSINDQIVQAARGISTGRPALLVVCMASGTFRDSGFIFRTAADRLAFEPGVASRIPRRFYPMNFGLRSGTAAFMSSVVPLRRTGPILRYELHLDRVIGNRAHRLLSFPHMNKANELRRRPDAPVQNALRMMPGTADRIRQLVETAHHDDIPILFIWQQCDFANDVVLGQLEAAADANPMVFVENLQPRWSDDEFRDRIHPTEEYRSAYARTHFDAIARVWRELDEGRE
jgi:hypothetical protein